MRRALQAVPSPGHDSGLRRAAEEAAAALYCVAACRLVDQAARAAGAANGYVLNVPSSERVICAVIATALFGGELRLMPAEELHLPTPEYVLEVDVPACGDRVADDFERATYAVLFANDREATQVTLDSGPLTSPQREKLAARIRTIKRVVRGLVLADVCQGFGTMHQPEACSAPSDTRDAPID